jgi:hypothetical protein
MPSIASLGIQDSAVTLDSTRVIQPPASASVTSRGWHTEVGIVTFD